MVRENGSIAVNTENIFPIIKQWLYSDKDIFLRELISNGSDAVQKLKRLSSIGQADIQGQPSFKVKIVLDKENGTIKVIDNGIGMTSDEVKKYINQVAFSSAQEFMEKYKDQPGEESQIIGHFGLGFYSAFMVSKKVEIDTLSWQEGAGAVRWTSETGIEYTMEASDRTTRGTTITLHIGDDSLEFLESYKLREILNKYCSFLPIEIYFEDLGEEDKDDEPTPINDTRPLWLKHPNDCTDDEYKEFYKKVFNDFKDPLFWIHLNVDYPFSLKGILYFPRLNNQFDTLEGQIKLFSNQVFVADNIKEVIPEFLMLLKGTIDCPDLPLNVSRSFLQNDGYVQKISSHISKKVGDKLTSLFKDERENYNKYWDDINPFIKYGCLRDDKFYEQTKDIVIFKTMDEDYVTIEEYLDRNKEKHENEVFYVSDKTQQSQYIQLFKENGIDAVYLDNVIDTHFISFLEMKEQSIKFKRVDADISHGLKDTVAEDDKESIKVLETMFKDAVGKDELQVKVEALKNSDISAMILSSEESRRMQEMAARFGDMGMDSPFPQEEILVVNRNSGLVKSLMELSKAKDRDEDIEMICHHIYDLALISHKPLDAEEMAGFIERSSKVLGKLAALEME
ncbi:MAG TPA: molecular chaperone HtpG [Clostridia bacterium]|nr:molecular chaperone HtpG [Clostridia bacterium]